MLMAGLGSPARLGGATGSFETSVSYGRLPIGDLNQKTYMLETKLNDGMWARFWVDEQGEILLVDTSVGLSMRSDLIDRSDYGRPGGMRGQPGSMGHRWNQ